MLNPKHSLAASGLGQAGENLAKQGRNRLAAIQNVEREPGDKVLIVGQSLSENLGRVRERFTFNFRPAHRFFHGEQHQKGGIGLRGYSRQQSPQSITIELFLREIQPEIYGGVPQVPVTEDQASPVAVPPDFDPVDPEKIQES